MNEQTEQTLEAIKELSRCRALNWRQPSGPTNPVLESALLRAIGELRQNLTETKP